ncbi:MAG: polymerase, sigma-24 subunit, subfamily [Verrucomicrobiales bacterium]|nr:polymerase, sigma-24 subunit, subfamily [Verrucomicrobiales bacterium]
MEELDDIALLRAYVEHGSEDAFATIVARHVNKVYSVALRHTRNPQQAQEITQVVFIILARKARALGKKVILEGWLYQTARLTALASVRSEVRRAHREQEAYMQSIANENESEVWSQIAPLLDSAIASLNEADRRAVVLRFLYGKDTKEVGAVLGSNEGAARIRLHRAMEKLRHFFHKRGIVSTSEILSGAISAHVVQTAPIGLAKSATAFALAKAPAASASTLTLIKGALKIMAWSKVKTAVVTGVVVLLVASTASIVVKEIRSRTAARPIACTTAATGSIKGRFFGRGELVNAGNTTPEDAWESRYWARAQGDYDAVIAATDRQAVADAKKWMGDKATFRSSSREEFATSFQGFQILARKDLSSDKVELKYQFTFANRSTPKQAKIVTMVKVNGAWICAQTRAHDASWDSGSEIEPGS